MSKFLVSCLALSLFVVVAGCEKKGDSMKMGDDKPKPAATTMPSDMKM